MNHNNKLNSIKIFFLLAATRGSKKTCDKKWISSNIQFVKVGMNIWNEMHDGMLYAKYKENKDLTFNVLNLKNEQKAEIVINVPSQKKDPKSIIQVIFAQ